MAERRHGFGSLLLATATFALAAGCAGGNTTTDTATSSAETVSPTNDRSAVTATQPSDIAATSTPESTSPTTTEATADAAAFDFSAIDPVVQGFVTARGLNGAGLVVVDGEQGAVYEQYWGEFDDERVSFVASSSKMLVAGILLHLQDQGLLDMDAPVADVVEWGTAHPAVTPAQLVSNSSGLVGLDPTFMPHICQFLPNGTLQDCARTIFTTPDDDALTVLPDTEFRYGGGQWQVAGAVAEAASGRSWAELVHEVYVEPCGADSLGFNNHFTRFEPGGLEYPADFGGDPAVMPLTANPNMEGGAYITAPDYADLLLMLLRGGRCGDTQVLSSDALAAMFADRTGEAYGSPVGYGMGWWIDRSTGQLTDPGAYGSVPWLDLDAGIGAYLVIESDAATGIELAVQIHPLIAAAMT